MSTFPAILEGDPHLADHPAVIRGDVAYACQLKTEPYVWQAEWGQIAARHWAGLAPDAAKAMKPTWLGARGMDIDRRLDPEKPGELGPLVGCTQAEWIEGMIAGRFLIDGEDERLMACLAPCREVFFAGSGPKVILVNSEPQSEMHAENKATQRAWAALYADARWLKRLPVAARAHGPETWGDVNSLNIARVTAGRLFHAAKVATIRMILGRCGLLVPGVTVVLSFCRFGATGTDASGSSDDPIPALAAPRDKGVVWAGNWQWYGMQSWEATRASLFRAESSGPVWPTITPLNAERGVLSRGTRGGVVWWINEDDRARVEGRADPKTNLSMLSEPERKGSENWLAQYAADLTIKHRSTL